MKPRANEVPRAQKSQSVQGEGPNWILIAGGALLSALSIRLGYKLKQALDVRQQENASNGLKGLILCIALANCLLRCAYSWKWYLVLKLHTTPLSHRGNGKSSERRKAAGSRLHSNVYSFTREDDGCFNCISGNNHFETGTEGIMEIKCPPNGQMMTESDGALPLVTVPPPEFNKDNGVIWSSSPDRLELPPKPFHHSNCSDSPCVSESGSDIFTKREVIHKLRQQLKRRDDMILEMQDQIVELQNSLNAQLAHSTHLQSQLDATNRDLFDSEREIQRLRKAIADHCVAHAGPNDKPSSPTIWPSEARNGHANGYLDGESNFELPEKGKGDGERIEMLKREVGDLKEVIEGKEYLLQNYKEQRAELSMKITDLQNRLDSQLPNIL